MPEPTMHVSYKNSNGFRVAERDMEIVCFFIVGSIRRLDPGLLFVKEFKRELELLLKPSEKPRLALILDHFLQTQKELAIIVRILHETVAHLEANGPMISVKQLQQARRYYYGEDAPDRRMRTEDVTRVIRAMIALLNGKPVQENPAFGYWTFYGLDTRILYIARELEEKHRSNLPKTETLEELLLLLLRSPENTIGCLQTLDAQTIDWISPVFEELAALLGKPLIACLQTLADKFPEITYLAEDVEAAEAAFRHTRFTNPDLKPQVETAIRCIERKHPNDPRINDNLDALATLLSLNAGSTIKTLELLDENAIDWIAGVLSDISRELQSESFIAAIRKLPAKFPRLNLQHWIDDAADALD